MTATYLATDPPKAMRTNEFSNRILNSLDAVQNYVEKRNYKGYDPGDGLTSFLRPLTFGNLFAERILQQAVWKCPFNVRPLVGVVPLDSTKGRAFMAWGYILRYKAEGRSEYLTKARECLSWLDTNREAGHPGHCWGNHFDFTTRSGRMKAHTPTIVWSGLIGQAFLAAYEQTADEQFLKIADSICRWMLTLPREITPKGHCLSYVPKHQNSVHNSNLLGAAMLAATGKHTGNREYLDCAREAVRYSCTRQREDGSWWYGEQEKYHWIDNFHTAYNLDSLKRYVTSSGETEFAPAIERGYHYFKSIFFEDSGRPRYYHDRTFPIDIQCASQAIDTFCFFADTDPAAVTLATRVAEWTIANMQSKAGYFIYRHYPMIKARTPYFHWGQATTFKALSHLRLVLCGEPAKS